MIFKKFGIYNNVIIFLIMTLCPILGYGNDFKSIQGDSIIKDEKLIKSIDKTCAIQLFSEQAEEQRKSCILSKIKFNYYEFFEKIKNDNNIFYKKDRIELSLTKKFKEDHMNGYAEHNTFIVTKNNNKIISRLPIYGDKCLSEALTCDIQYHYIDEDLNIWLLQINEAEEGRRIKSYKKYKINKETAKIEKFSEEFFNE